MQLVLQFNDDGHGVEFEDVELEIEDYMGKRLEEHAKAENMTMDDLIMTILKNVTAHAEEIVLLEEQSKNEYKE